MRLYTSGESLLVGQIQVLDATGNVLKSAVTTDPTSGDLKIDVDKLTAGARYYVRVSSAAADGFGVGAYQLKVGFKDEPNADAKYLKDDGADDARGVATPLDGANGNGGYRAVLESRADVDWYRITAPADAAGQAAVVSVRGAKADGAPPALTAYDADGNPLLAQFLQSDARGYTVQVSGVAPGGTFYLRLAVPAGVDKVTDNYRLKVPFAPPQGANLDPLAMGQFNQQLTTAAGSLSVSASGLFQFYLSSGSLPDVPGGSLTLTVTDAKGKEVLTLTASSTQPAATGGVYLAAGSYTVTVALTLPKGVATNVGGDLIGGLGSDPIGTYAPPVGSTSPRPPRPPSYVYTGSTTARPTGSTDTF